ncbi:MAG TPA: DUF4203 domain-containing protein [Thermodesulfobacteriota bacterium]|nr:DUF4203 domain-containing protein [Thermodesulfobacteriota bacterium]
MNLHAEMYDYYIMAAVAVALIECFFGYRILRFLLGVLGFIAGAVVCGSMGYELTNGSEIVSIIAGIAGGLAGAFIMYTLYIVGVFAIGAALGFMTASYVFGIMNTAPVTIVLIAAAVLGGVLAAILQKPMLILATAFGGAYAAVTGVAYLLLRNFDPLDPEFLNTLSEDQLYRMAIIWFGLGVFGLVIQLMTLPRKEELKEESVETSDEDKMGEESEKENNEE